MPIRLKKLIGTVLLVALVIVYALAATTIAAGRLAESGPVVHLIFFLVIRPAVGAAGDGHHQMDGARAQAARLEFALFLARSDHAYYPLDVVSATTAPSTARGA